MANNNILFTKDANSSARLVVCLNRPQDDDRVDADTNIYLVPTPHNTILIIYNDYVEITKVAIKLLEKEQMNLAKYIMYVCSMLWKIKRIF